MVSTRTSRRHRPPTARPSVAVVGSGVSGLTAAYLLQRRYDVTLYERDDRLGGHAHTHDVESSGGGTIPVDSGFIVHNERTYPWLTKLFAELGVTTRETEMSMSVSCRVCGLEYAGARGLRGLFAQRSAITDRRFLRMLPEITRFHRQARRLLHAPSLDDRSADSLSLGGFLTACGFSRFFTTHFMLPLVAAVWSSGAGDALRYPARYLFRFLDHHGMLRVHGSPTWRTVEGGSRSYVERAAKHLSAVRTSTPVRAITRHADGVELRTDTDSVEHADHLVVATHADQALALLTDPTPLESDLLGAFESTVNPTVLHTDARLLPGSTGARASWNYVLAGCTDLDDGGPGVTMTYYLNRLHRLGAEAGDTHYLVSLGSSGEIDPATVIATMRYEHPLYTARSVAAAQRAPELTTARTAYAGAWQGWGFHEDGCASGVRAAASLGVPW